MNSDKLKTTPFKNWANVGYNNLGINYGYLLEKVPQNVLDELKSPIDNLLNNFNSGNKHNWNLAGEIQHEYKIPPTPQLATYVEKLCRELDNKSLYIINNFPKISNLNFDNVWVNFQKKYEYNPYHYHEGVFSFVIWYQIPYTFEEEKKYSYKTDNQGCLHGTFNFMVPNSFSSNHNVMGIDVGIDKSREGYIAIFPSNLSHCVYPFYSSDDYRITVSGNILPF